MPVRYGIFEGGRITVGDTIFANNGNHSQKGMWADGLTIKEASGAIIENNEFVDNTDVQLILGGCRHCTIRENRFRHTTNPDGGSFADLMLHAWPNQTSGQYDQTIVSNNDIDCGPDRNCGFGIMIGARPWYKALTSGGRVVDNNVRRAMIGINIDDLTGPMQIAGNVVSQSGGRFATTCGIRQLPAVNIAPQSEQFVDARGVEASSGGPGGNHEFAGCLANGGPLNKFR